MVAWRCSVKKTVLKDLAKFTGKRVYRSLYFNKVEGGGLQFYQKNTPAQVLSCEFCKIFRNTYFEEHLQMPVSRACLPWITSCLSYVGLRLKFTCVSKQLYRARNCSILTAQKMKFSIKDFFSKCDHIRSLRNP